jgi:hypothetical protein
VRSTAPPGAQERPAPRSPMTANPGRDPISCRCPA